MEILLSECRHLVPRMVAAWLSLALARVRVVVREDLQVGQTCLAPGSSAWFMASLTDCMAYMAASSYRADLFEELELDIFLFLGGLGL